MILVVGIAAAGLIFAVSQWAGAPTWVPAFVGVPIESVDAADRQARSGRREVQARARRRGHHGRRRRSREGARRAREGRHCRSPGRPGLELFDQPSWGMTDFTQRINYRRALEGELERTIGKMRGIECAQVHLVMHETDGFGARRQADRSERRAQARKARPTPKS